MIDSRMPQPPEGFTGGAAWRSQALRVVQAPTIEGGATAVANPPAPHGAAPVDYSPTPIDVAPTGERGGALLRPDRTFAQHGLLGAPDALVIHVGVEGIGSGAFDIEVAFAVREVRDSIECEASAGWYEPSEGWSYTVRCIEGRALVILAYEGFLADGEVAEATFRMTLARRVDLSNGLLLRTSALTHEATGAQANDLAIPVERLGL